MKKNNDLLVFTLDDRRFAIPIVDILKVLQVVEVKPIPNMPKYLHGVMNYYGDIRPVLNLHYIFSCPPKEIELSNELIVLTDKHKGFVLLVNNIQEVISVSDDDISLFDPMISDKQHVKGVVKLNDGLVLINDVNYFLDPKELKELSVILEKKSINVLH